MACIKSYPGSELICISYTWFSLLILPAWNPIQEVSAVQLPCLMSIADIACMKSHPGSECCAAALLDIHCWHCLHEIPSSEWVLCPCSAWYPLLTWPAWNPIQRVNAVPLALLDIHCWHGLHEIPSSQWVLCCCSAWFPLLTWPAWNPIQQVSAVWLLCLVSIADMACMKSHPASECCVAALLDVHCWYGLHEIPSSEWVLCCCSAWFPLLTLPAWNLTQTVSPVQFLCFILIYDILSSL